MDEVQTKVIEVAKCLSPPFTRQQLLNECRRVNCGGQATDIEDGIWRLIGSGRIRNDGHGNLTVVNQ